MAAPTFADLQGYVNSLAGVDITDPERDGLLNEAHVELCVRSGWSKDTLDFGPTVLGQSLYVPPASFRQPADDVVTVGGLDYKPADPQTVRSIRSGRLGLVEDGVWWFDYEDAVRKLGISPVSSADAAVQMLSVVTPAPMVEEDDEPIVPWDFRTALVHWVRATALGFSEDNEDGQQAGFSEFERQVQRLTGLRIDIENGDGPIQVQVAGVHW